MSLDLEGRPAGWRTVLLAALFALAALILAVRAGGNPGTGSAPPPATGSTQVPDEAVVLDTPANLQAAFTNEMNAHERYRAYARRAEAEGLPQVARLFRACAQAESIHAKRLAQSIAWTGQPARALLERVTVGTTQENLRAAISSERYECETWYPALIARARADHQSRAVRSLTFALGAERGHLELLERALGNPDAPTVAARLFVCPGCGRITDTRDYAKCPGCFTSASRFLRAT